LMPSTDSHGNNAGNNHARYIGLGFAFILILGVLAGGGFFVDGALGTLPLFLLVGLGVGFAGGLYYVYLQLKKLGDG
jgi:ATP synthase protein I